MQVKVLTAALEEAQEVLQYIRVEAGPVNDLVGPHIVFEGANVHVMADKTRRVHTIRLPVSIS